MNYISKVNKLIILSALFWGWSLLALVSAETVILKTGEKIEGKIIEQADNHIMIDFYGTTQPYYFEDIESIDGKQVLVIPVTDELLNIYYIKALEHASGGNFKEAEEQFNKSLEICNPYCDLKNSIERNLRILRQVNDGVLTREYALQLFKGENLFSKEELQQALSYFQEAMRINPNDANAYCFLGTTYYRLGDYQQAGGYLKEAFSRQPDDYQICGFLGCVFSQLGKYEEGIFYFQKTIQMKPDEADAYNGLGIIYFNSGRNEEALTNLQKAKEIFKKRGKLQRVTEIEGILAKIPSSTRNLDSDYSCSEKEIPEVCFFPVDKARWNGYKVLAKEWKKLTRFQKNEFIVEGIKEIENKEHLSVGFIDGVPDLIDAIDKTTHLFGLGGEGKIPVITLIYKFLVQAGYIKEDDQRSGALQENALFEFR